MKKLQNMSSWKTLAANNPAVFPSPTARTVNLTIMAVQKACLSIKVGKSGPNIVKVPVDGLETISFSVPGAYTLEADKDVQLYNSEWSEVGFDGTGETYTSVIQRQPRNPEIEAIEAKLFHNQQVRLAQIEADSRREVAVIRSEAARKKAATDAAEKKAATDAAQKQAAMEAAIEADSASDAANAAEKPKEQTNATAVTTGPPVAGQTAIPNSTGGASNGPPVAGG